MARAVDSPIFYGIKRIIPGLTRVQFAMPRIEVAYWYTLQGA